jgi:heavy metal sensor kinase
MKRSLASTRGRLVALSVAILAAALVIADGGVLASLAVTGRSQSDSVLVTQANSIASTIDDADGRISFGSNDLPAETQDGIAVDAAIVDASGPVAQTPGQPLTAPVLLDLARRADRAGAPVWTDLVDRRGIPRRVYATPLAGTSRPAPVLIVSRSVGELQATLRQTLLLLGLLAVVVVVVGGLMTYWLAGRALRPVRRIASLARSLSERDLHRRVDVRVPDDELGELVATFNSMLARLEAAFEGLYRFTADASHELRAPLAVMRAELEGSLSRMRSRAEYWQSQEMLQVEVEHLSRLADQLLILARADAGALVPALEQIDVADIVHETAGRWEATADRHGTPIHVSAPESGTVEADPSLVRRVLDNLVDNAIRHAPVGTAILVRAHRADSGWSFEVADQGPGVPAEYRDRLFTRFGRADDVRTPDGSGAGLGLALSAAIASAHGGSLKLVDEAGQGAIFRLHLPAS